MTNDDTLLLEKRTAPPQRTLADRVYEEMLQAIISGEIPLGAKLSQPGLARRFGTSRGPLREAIERLEARRLVTRTAHIGARVVELTQEALIETYFVREALEGMAARLAAERMEDEEIQALEDLLDEYEGRFHTVEAYNPENYDWDFHYRLVIGSRNQLIKQVLVDDLYQLVRLCRAQHKSKPGRTKRAFVEHRRIVEALKDRDAELSELLMRRHIATARSVLQAGIIEQENERRKAEAQE